MHPLQPQPSLPTHPGAAQTHFVTTLRYKHGFIIHEWPSAITTLPETPLTLVRLEQIISGGQFECHTRRTPNVSGCAVASTDQHLQGSVKAIN